MNEERQVRRYDGVSFNATISRGTGVRNEEELEVKVHGEDMDEALDRLDRGIDELKRRAPELREVQTVEEDDG